MARKVKIESRKVHRNENCIRTQRDPFDNLHHEGCVHTPHGIVEVHCFDGGKGCSYSYWFFIYNGQRHYRWEPTAHTSLGLAIVAGRFARQMVNG